MTESAPLSNPKDLKLYRVYLKGDTSYSNKNGKFSPYVLAFDAESAYRLAREILDKENYGFWADRQLDWLEVLASSYPHAAPGILRLEAFDHGDVLKEAN